MDIADPEGGELDLHGAAALMRCGGEHGTVSVSIDAGKPQVVAASWKVATTSAALNTPSTFAAISTREWSSITWQISTSRPFLSFR